MRALLLALSLLCIPLALAQPGNLPKVEDVEAHASNQRVDLQWATLLDDRIVGYRAYVYSDGALLQAQNTTTANAWFPLTNERTYVFVIAARAFDGSEGPPSDPVGATPRLEGDLAYLTAGLNVVWIGLFGYVWMLGRKERALEAKLNQLIQQQRGRMT